MAKPRAYADRTEVSVEDTILEIRRIVSRYAGEQFVFGLSEEECVIGFTKAGRQVRCRITLSGLPEQRKMSLARGLLLVVKARLEAVSSGIQTFEEAFLADIVLPDGRSVGHLVKDELALAYRDGRQPPKLLPSY